MKVSLDVLQRVYEAFQDQDNNDVDADVVDPEGHLHYINSFDMPLWNWSHEKGAFEMYA